MELKGTHGTCISHAERIALHGFKMKSGRRGTGAYFWAYTGTLKGYATSLAKAWWTQAVAWGQYNSCENQDFRVLCVKINIEDELFLDLEEHEMRGRLAAFLNESYSKSIPADRIHLAERAYDAFVNIIERQLNKKFKAIHVTVNPPKRDCFENADRLPEFDLMGMPSCYVVKDNNCIAIE